MARPNSVIGQAIQESTRMKTIAGENDPRLRPIDLPDPSTPRSIGDILEGGNARQNQTIEGGYSDLYDLPGTRENPYHGKGTVLGRDSQYRRAVQVFNQEYYKRKGVDVDSRNSQYPDGPTLGTILPGMSKEKLKEWERYMENRLNNGIIDEANPEFRNPRGSKS